VNVCSTGNISWSRAKVRVRDARIFAPKQDSGSLPSLEAEKKESEEARYEGDMWDARSVT
jgi:hypothetical protein